MLRHTLLAFASFALAPFALAQTPTVTLGAEVLVCDPSSPSITGQYAARMPSVTIGSGNLASVVWEDRTQNPASGVHENWSIYFRDFTLGSPPNSTPFKVSSDTNTGDAEEPQIVSVQGHHAVTWVENSDLTSKIFVRSYDPASTWSSSVDLSGATSQLAYKIQGASIAMAMGGATYLAWVQREIYYDFIAARLISHDVGYIASSADYGATWNAPVELETADYHNGVISDVQVAVSSSGTCHVAYLSNLHQFDPITGLPTTSGAPKGFVVHVTTFSGTTLGANSVLPLVAPAGFTLNQNSSVGGLVLAAGAEGRVILAAHNLSAFQGTFGSVIWSSHSKDDGANWSAMEAANEFAYASTSNPWPFVIAPEVGIVGDRGVVVYSRGDMIGNRERGMLVVNDIDLSVGGTPVWSSDKVLFASTVGTNHIVKPSVSTNRSRIAVSLRIEKVFILDEKYIPEEYSTIHLAVSDDKGANWTVHANPLEGAGVSPTVDPKAAGSFNPAVALSGNQCVVVFDDRRNVTAPTLEPYTDSSAVNTLSTPSTLTTTGYGAPTIYAVPFTF